MEILFYILFIGLALFLARDKKCINNLGFWIVTILIPLVGIIWASCGEKE